MEDEAIIGLFYERSEQAVEELDRKYGPAVRQVAANILGDSRDAEECADDAYLGVWDTVPSQWPEHLGAYVCRIARNIAVKRYRAGAAKKRNTHYDAALDELAGSLAGPEDAQSALEARELAAAIDGFLDGLPDTDRWLFLRRYWFGDGLQDLAVRTGLSPHRISVRLSRIRKKLRQYLTKEGLL